jgi:hypothetical protein
VTPPASGETPAGFDPAGVPASDKSAPEVRPGQSAEIDGAAGADQSAVTAVAAPAEGTWWQGAASGPLAPQGADSAELPGAAAQTPADSSRVHRARVAFRHWRRTRPFWGGLLITAGGGEILFTEKAPLGVVLHVGPQGLAGYLLPSMMILCGLLLWFAPAQRTFYSVLSVLLSLGTWLTANLGGFLIGMLLGVVGGSLAFGWTPRGGGRPARQRKEKPKKGADPARV